jgi:hypothetical protein
MPPRDLNDAKYWRGQAAELRAGAKTYKNEFAAQAARRMADNYDQMAERAEDRVIHGIDLPTPGALPIIKRIDSPPPLGGIWIKCSFDPIVVSALVV